MGYADNYKKGAYWTVDENDKIVNKNGYPPNKKLLEENNQRSFYTAEDIPFNEAVYKNGKVKKHIKTADETETELKERARMAEYKVITRRTLKMAIDQLEAEGMKFKYNHLEPYTYEYVDFRNE